jgi:prepilin-type processing-associated H-X9-DG protein
MYTDENDQRLPLAELLPSMPINPAAPLPRICDVLGPYVGRVITTTNGSAPVFKCPSDKGRRYIVEGSSYEWNAELNGHRIDETRSTTLRLIEVELVNGEEVVLRNEEKVLLFPPATTPLLLDYEDNHPRPPKPGKNVVFMDGHVSCLEIPEL